MQLRGAHHSPHTSSVLGLVTVLMPLEPRRGSGSPVADQSGDLSDSGYPRP